MIIQKIGDIYTAHYKDMTAFAYSRADVIDMLLNKINNPMPEVQNELPTVYTSSDGKQTPIVEMNNFHLVNSLLKIQEGIGSDIGRFKTPEEQKSMLQALKAEVFKRMDNRPAQV